MGAQRPGSRGRAWVVTIVVLALGLLAPVRLSPTHASDAGDEAAFLSSTNALRATLGLPPVEVDGELTAIARQWSSVMAGAGDIWHSPDLAGQVTVGRWLTLNESVGTGPGVTAIHAALLDSPGHRSNLVNPRYTHIGIGVARVGNVVYVTQTFGRADGSSRAPVPAARTASSA